MLCLKHISMLVFIVIFIQLSACTYQIIEGLPNLLSLN